ncbi:hypothetical protein COCOBI_13-4500 [Coccomyxa sp. Obi]|nr:hypothetical protein COCOBI_13-4500 [Coccomyxa sp. Obi]
MTGASSSADEHDTGPSQLPPEREDLAEPLERKETTCSNPLHTSSLPADSRHVHPPDLNFSSPSLQQGHTDRLRDAPSLQADWTANPVSSSDLIRLPPCPSRGCSARASELHCSSAATEDACLGSDCARPGAAAEPGREALHRVSDGPLLFKSGGLAEPNLASPPNCERSPQAHRPSRAAQLAVKAVALLFFTSFLLLFGGFHWYIHQAPPPGGPGRRRPPRRPARVPRTAVSVEFSPTDFRDLISANLGAPASDDGELLSWEHLAAEHGSAAVVVIGDGDARPRPVADDASERPAPVVAAAERSPRYSALADAGGDDEEIPVLLSQAAFHWGQPQTVVENTTSEELSVGDDSGDSPVHEQPKVDLEVEVDTVLSQLGAGPAGVQMRQPTFAELSALSSKFGDASLVEDQISDRLQLDGIHTLRQAAGVDAVDADKEVSVQVQFADVEQQWEPMRRRNLRES